MANLDRCIPKLMGVVSSRGGATGTRIRQIKDVLLENNSVEMFRDVAICCLIVYFGEKEEELLIEFDREDFEAGLHEEMMTIDTIANQATQSNRKAAIVIEGTQLLEVNNNPRSCTLFMGLIYALNQSCAKNLKALLKYFRSCFLALMDRGPVQK